MREPFTILSVEDHLVVATASAGTVGLEIAGSTIETECVEEIMVHVGDVEELGHGSVHVGRRWAQGSRVWEYVVVGAPTTGSVVVEVGTAPGRVRLGDGIVSPRDGVAGRSIAVPPKRRSGGVLRVGNGRSATIGWIVDSEGAMIQSA